MSWSPTGRPSESPHGTDMPGRPAMLTGSVQASDEVHRDGVVQAGAEAEGDASGSSARRARRAGRQTPVEVGLDERPDLLGLQVVGVVVAGRERVRAEHDAALDLGAEAPSARRQVVGQDVAVARGRGP